MRVNLELYSPTRSQYKVHLSPFQFNVICFGRQSGKSTYGNNKLLERAFTKANGVYWFVGPTYRLAEQMHDRAKYALQKNGVIKDKSDSDFMIQLKYSESRIFYKSGDRPESLLGETLDGAVIDEAADQDENIWTRYIMPMLGTTNGWADIMSTPDGLNWFYDMFEKSKTNFRWGSFHAPSTDCPFWSKEMLEEAKSGMSPDLYAQEILAEFRDIGSGTCYVTFGMHNIRDTNPFAEAGQTYSPHLPILVGMDFNLSPMSWVLGQQKNRQFYWAEEISQQRPDGGMGPTESAANHLVNLIRGHKAGVVIIGDASGKAGQRSAPGGQSDYDTVKNILRRAEIPFQDKTPDSNPPIKDRVNTVNAALKSADGTVNMWFNSRCKNTIKDMRRRAWKQGTVNLSFNNSDPTAGHLSDAIGYPVCVLAPIKSISAGAKMRVITRSF